MDRPLCKCHGEPQLKAGKYWRCKVRTARQRVSWDKSSVGRWQREHPERRRASNREAQRKWREKHPGLDVRKRGKHRTKVWAKTGGYCYLCGQALALSWEMDHVSPLAKGGPDTLGNLMPSCFGCNRWKRDKLLLPSFTIS